MLSSTLPFAASADTLDEIKRDEAQTAAKGEQLNATLNAALDDANKTYQAIEGLQDNISKAQANLKKYNTEIVSTQNVLKKRKTAIAKQMRNLQIEGTNTQTIEVLLSAKNISELISRTMALNTIRQAQNEKVDSLNSAKKKLVTLKERQAKTTAKLEKSKASLDQEAVQLEQKVASVKSQVADNQATMDKLANSRAAEEKREADAKARKAAEAKAEQEAAVKATEAANSGSTATVSKPTNSTPVVTNPSYKPAKPVSPGNGRVLTMQATGYSVAQPGMGYITATGIDLRKNPNVIAVDPGVIRLGSLVEVSGYGFAIAGDTGGAINGNIIDLHFPTVQQCINWGRRTVSVKLL
jgi:3D (Asp-Asp-Asp) domain-containing protein